MPGWTVRRNCEYSTYVEAPDEETAIAKADETDVNDWDQQAWSETEAEMG